ncbi:hypothetical protein [Ruminiclostridium cellulolyticum]|uniref:Uncharacterized protein n=1 Tax=Ruminiclostridium cellulolyticum (strain ATCC 35319 / DSM 5812 / JCM 6584 / H10) TaxID=394503 RepID=B8I290_RUMCH|nr:hypothetical protein [Ruminiclostridium cellulolyticum]ACL77753.1 hypothetical protein Ccel_3465 [Ruminiclostridium cellulolyticum H10]
MNKRILSFLLIITLILTCFTNLAYSAANTKVKVTLKSVVCIKNDHVGNEWGFGATVNKKTIYEGETIEISTTPKGKITIVSMAEEDDSYPDYGSKTLAVSVSKLKANKSTNYTSNVTVIENRGRYSGNSAVWKFTYVIKKK